MPTPVFYDCEEIFLNGLINIFLFDYGRHAKASFAEKLRCITFKTNNPSNLSMIIAFSVDISLRIKNIRIRDLNHDLVIAVLFIVVQVNYAMRSPA